MGLPIFVEHEATKQGVIIGKKVEQNEYQEFLERRKRTSKNPVLAADRRTKRDMAKLMKPQVRPMKRQARQLKLRQSALTCPVRPLKRYVIWRG